MPELRFLRRSPWSAVSRDGRAWESHYRDRWRHERVVRSTHGVNCTGSCSWRVHVKDGVIAWETQQTDYPSNGPDEPDYEPRGCPRGASFSWYVYSPLRVRHPYVRGALLDLWRSALEQAEGDPVEAWRRVAAAGSYKALRGKGGFVRASWEEVETLIAASLTDTIERYGPDRIAGFSPIPAMSMASYTGGARFLSLIGATILSFYDWYCDLPPASPQVFGDQTDVPEGGDWFSASYLMLWGSNVPMTRTPDAHFMTEARYRGQKVVVVSPDYSQHTKFADSWLPVRPGTDGALAMAMGHVILKEFYVDRQVPRFLDYARRFTDLPYLVELDETPDGPTPGRFLRAADVGSAAEHAEWKPVVWDGGLRVPEGSLGHRWDSQDGSWNLRLDGIEPLLTFLDDHDEIVELALPAHDRVVRRGVPAKRIGGRLVTTVLDLMLANYGVARHGLPGDWPFGYDDAEAPYTPGWQEGITGVPRCDCVRTARELADNAERSGGRSMIVLGAGVNHWYHGDTIYRSILSLLLLTGCQGVNGGGWAHYVGQEKVRPVAGLSQLAFGLDWQRPSRQQAATPFWYLATDQWRYDEGGSGPLVSPLAARRGRHMADEHALAARLGWLPSYPQFGRSSLGLEPEDALAGLRDGSLRFACEDPDAPENWPRVLLLWRANLLGSSAKGHEYFLRHLLGADHAVAAEESEVRPEDVTWHEQAPEGKLDLLVTLDYRMSGSALYSDVVLPAATWYEKDDISSTDLHPFVHPFQAAVPPQWESRPDWDVFVSLSRAFSELAGPRLGVQRDLVAAPLLHDSPDELAQPEVRDWRRGECEAVPGKTMPKLVVVERDYGAVHERMTSLGPLAASLGVGAKGISWKPEPDGLGPLRTAREVCNTILSLSGTTNGAAAVAGWRSLEREVGAELVDLVGEHAGDRITFDDLVEHPRRVFTSAEWSGIESTDRRYSPFTLNVERAVPWRTLTGRQQLYVDHEWMRDFGEALPVYRPPLELDSSLDGVVLRYLTPHSKWSVHSTYADVETLLTLFRGGPTVWLSPDDAARAGLADNDWAEIANRHGKLIARAVVSHRIPVGSAFVYHAQDRHVGSPHGSGTHNSPTHIHMKPTHLIGGYAQLSYGFNYYGPIGAQRDETCAVRRLEEVSW